jgi:hypothetical protein
MTTKEKQSAIASALAKLREEDKELLGLVKKKTKPRVKRSYKMTVSYMIGDSNGYTTEVATIKANNPFLPIVEGALKKLKVCKGSWGLQLKTSDYETNYEYKNISEVECDLLCLVSGYGVNLDEDEVEYFLKENNFELTEENENFLREFSGLFIDETSYSFLAYEGYKLT